MTTSHDRPGPDGLPAGLLADVGRAVGADITHLGRLTGGFDVGAEHVQVAGGPQAVLKAWPRTDPDDPATPDQMEAARRARRITEHMRGLGYPTPAWLDIGATDTHIWHLIEYVDATPAPELTPDLVEQLIGINALQAGQGTEPYDHRAYSWRLTTGGDFGEDLAPQLTRAIGALPDYSPEVASLVARVRDMCAEVPAPRDAPDMVHADDKPDNVLVRDGRVVAVIDVGNAGRGTRATDLTTLLWHTVGPTLDVARDRLWRQILEIVGGEESAVLAGTQILTQLEFPIRTGRHAAVPAVIAHAHRTLDELEARR